MLCPSVFHIFFVYFVDFLSSFFKLFCSLVLFIYLFFSSQNFLFPYWAVFPAGPFLEFLGFWHLPPPVEVCSLECNNNNNINNNNNNNNDNDNNNNDSNIDIYIFFYVTKALEEAGKAEGIQVEMVHRKINLQEDTQAWEHEKYSMRRLPAFTLSRLTVR